MIVLHAAGIKEKLICSTTMNIFHSPGTIENSLGYSRIKALTPSISHPSEATEEQTIPGLKLAILEVPCSHGEAYVAQTGRHISNRIADLSGTLG
jgi:hypothetical protein